MRESFTYGSVRGAARKERSLPRLTEVRDQTSKIGKAGRRAMTKKIIVLALCSLLLAPRWTVDAQQPAKVSRIGYLGLSFPSANVARIEALRRGLRDLGYVEGKNIVLEWRWAEGKAERIPELAAELVKLKVDIIVTGGSTAT